MKKRKFKVQSKANVSDVVVEDKKVSKEFKRQVNFTVISIFLVIILMISGSYAIFSDVQRQQTSNTVTVGKLKVDFVDTEEGMGNIINLNGAYPTPDSDGLTTSPYVFKITNSGSLDSKYKIKIVDDTNVINEDNCSNKLLPKDKIRVSVNGGTPFTLSEKETLGYVIDEDKLFKNQSKTYQIRVWISDTAGNEVLRKHYHGKIVVESEHLVANTNILKAYTYNQTSGAENYCVTGEEATCVETDCYKTRTANSCQAGTIIKYKVNEATETFHVMRDDANTITMQSQTNIVKSTAWHAGENNNSQGPDTILPALESATSSWTNIEDQTYQAGTTSIFNNQYTGCTYSGGASGTYLTSCSINMYTLPSRTVKARMITVLEASATGCLVWKDGSQYTNIMGNSIDAYNSGSCPIWMYNYLQDSTNYGATQNETNQWGYWTMSANSGASTNSWNVNRSGYLYGSNASNPNLGARAVVVVSK